MPAPQGRDLELTRKQLEEWLARRVGGDDVHVGELSGPGATGFSNETVLFDLDYRRGGERVHEALVCRIKPTGYQVFPEYDLGRQFDVMQRLAPTVVPVPAMRWQEKSDDPLGAPFYVMSQVAGRIPTDNPPYHVGGWLTEETPAARERLWNNAYDVLADIHQLDWRQLGFEFLDAPERGVTPLDQELAYYESYLEWGARGKAQPTVEPALEWLKANKPSDEPVALCWGDARIGNMIFGENERVMAVLDWEMVSLGNPEKDLAWGLFLDRHHSEGIENPRLEGFPTREQTVARYEARSGHAVRHLHYYEVYAAFRFAVIMIRLAQQMQHYEVMALDSDYETNNIVTRLLAKLLKLPPPGD